MRSAKASVRKIFLPDFGEVYFNVHTFFLVISEQLQNTYTFDCNGRFLSAFLHGKNYKRSLASDVMMKHDDHATGKQREILSEEDTIALIEKVLSRVARIHQNLPEREFEKIRVWLDRILEWDSTRLLAEREQFNAIYPFPVGILPPDQYLSVVLQATEGCTWNRCTFCTLYHDRPFRIKPPEEFREHAEQVRDFLGRAIGLRKSVFLADANALVIPQERLMELLRITHDVFSFDEGRPEDFYQLDGIYSFLDIFGAEHKTLEEYRELREARVKRVYIGLETGDSELFQMLNKPGSPAECIESVRTIKEAGIQVGVILLAGAGGERFSANHIAHSVEVIEQMELDRGDIVYVSPLIISEKNTYAQHMQELGVRELESSETMEQVRHFKANLKSANGPRVTLYHINEFLY